MEDNFDNVPQESEMPQDTQQNSQQDSQQNTEYQYSYGNNQYQSYNYNSNSNQNQNVELQEDTSVMSMGDWLITVLALLIPCAGIILYFVWAFGKNGNANRRNYCRAYLIFWAITRVLLIIFFVIMGAFMAAGNGYYY